MPKTVFVQAILTVKKKVINYTNKYISNLNGLGVLSELLFIYFFFPSD